MIKQRTEANFNEDIKFILQSYCRGGIQLLIKYLYYNSINTDKLLELFERSMPDEIQNLLLNYTFTEAVELFMPEFLEI